MRKSSSLSIRKPIGKPTTSNVIIQLIREVEDLKEKVADSEKKIQELEKFLDNAVSFIKKGIYEIHN